MPHSPLRSAALCLLLALLVVPASSASAQQQGDPDLPDIAPREVEIRGEGDVVLPTLERQPIRVLAPPPALLNRPGQLPRVAPDTLAPLRLPPHPVALDLAETERPSPTPLAPHGAFEASAGRYWTRRLMGRVDWPFGAQTHMDASLTYRGTEGHQPVAASTLQSSSDLLEGQWSLSTGTKGWIVTPEIGGMLSDYVLYGRLPALADGSPGFTPERQGRDGYVSAEVQGLRTRRASLSAGIKLRGTRYNTMLRNTEPERVEQRLSGRLAAEVPFSALTWYADVEGATAGVERHAFTAADRAYAEGETGLRFRLGSSADARIGLRAMSFHAGAPPDASATYLTPTARIEVRPSSALAIYARNAPDLAPNRLPALFRQNPYLVSQPRLRPTVRTVDAEAGLKWGGSRSQLTVFGGYVHAPWQRYFYETTRAANSAASAVGYEEANVVKGGARFSLMAPGSLQMTLSGVARRGRLSQPDEPIPYFAPLKGKLSVLYFFERGELEAGGVLLGSRPLQVGGGRELGAYLGVDVTARYQIAAPFGIVLRLANAVPGALERWHRYPQPPLVASLGLRATW